MLKRLNVKENQAVLRLVNGKLVKIYTEGKYWIKTVFEQNTFIAVDRTTGLFSHPQKEIFVQSGLFEGLADVYKLKDTQRAILWKDSRFAGISSEGTLVVWKKPFDIKVEIVSIEGGKFEHEKLETIIKGNSAETFLEVLMVEEGQLGLFFFNGKLESRLEPGRYAFWKNAGKIKLYQKDMREKVVEVPAQDIMTADKVTLRMTAVLAYRIGDVLKAVMTADDIVTSVYREVQLALRAVTGTRELDAILADKQSLSGELEKLVVSRLTEFGVAIVSIGIRDIILPGEMKDILNKVMEAKKKAEANLITRREETAALRSQANTAKLLEDNAVLMRLRELEVIEKAVEGANLTFVVGEKGLSQTVTKML